MRVTFDYFIASRYRNRARVIALAKRLRNCGYAVYCFPESAASREHCAELHEDPERSMQRWESIPNWRDSAGVQQIFSSDINALRASTNVILLLPAGKSAHMEAGVAYGLEKHLVLIGDQQETESLYLMFNEEHQSEEDFLKSLPLASKKLRQKAENSGFA